MHAIRPSIPGDTPALKEIWRCSFGDPPAYIDAFFTRLYRPGMAAVAICDGKPVAAAYAIDGLSFQGQPGVYIYAVGTLPEYRSQGLGTAVTRRAVELGGVWGTTFAVVCPAGPELFDFYQKNIGFQPVFTLAESTVTPDTLPAPQGRIHPIAPADYCFLRERLLNGQPHVSFSVPFLAYQQLLSQRAGGNLYRMETDLGPACAAVEIYQGHAIVKELLAPKGADTAALSLLHGQVEAQRYTVRTPGPGRTFAMLYGMDAPPNPYFGFALD